MKYILSIVMVVAMSILAPISTFAASAGYGIVYPNGRSWTQGGITGTVSASKESGLKKGDKVAIVGFGTFEVRTRAAREGVNPRTKEKMPIPESKLPAFKAGKALKEAVEKA